MCVPVRTYSDLNLLPVQPLLALPQQFVVLLSSMTRHILLDLNTHNGLLTISEVSVSNGEALEQRIVDTRHFPWVHRDELVLFVKVSDVFDLPLVCCRFIAVEEHAEATVGFGVNFVSVNLRQ